MVNKCGRKLVLALLIVLATTSEKYFDLIVKLFKTAIGG